MPIDNSILAAKMNEMIKALGGGVAPANPNIKTGTDATIQAMGGYTLPPPLTAAPPTNLGASPANLSAITESATGVKPEPGTGIFSGATPDVVLNALQFGDKTPPANNIPAAAAISSPSVAPAVADMGFVPADKTGEPARPGGTRETPFNPDSLSPGTISDGKTLYQLGSNSPSPVGASPAVAYSSPAVKSSSGEAKPENPNDNMFRELQAQLQKVATTGEPSVGRATQISAIEEQMKLIAPMTSFGAFGISGGRNTTEKEIASGREATTERGQDITATTASEGHKMASEDRKIAYANTAANYAETARHNRDTTASANMKNLLAAAGLAQKEKLASEAQNSEKVTTLNPDGSTTERVVKTKGSAQESLPTNPKPGEKFAGKKANYVFNGKTSKWEIAK